MSNSDTSADRQEDPGADRSWLGWLQIAAIIAVIASAAGITLWLSASSQEAVGEAPEQPPAPVRVVQAERGNHTLSIEATGTVSVTAFVELTAEVGGRIVEVSNSARAGAAFEAGQVLFTIDPRDYEVAVSRARAALADASAALQTEEAEARIARTEWDTLYPDREITALAAREPQLEAARARRLSAQADLTQARLDLERTRVSLPFAGRIAQSAIEAGRLAAPGQALGSAYSLDAVEIVAPVAPEDLSRLNGAIGRSVEIRIEGAREVLQGRVARAGARLDERTRFIDLYIDAGGEALQLQPGLFADLRLAGPTLDDVMIIPAGAVQGLDTVRVVEDGRIAERTIEVLDRTRGQVIASPFDTASGVIVSSLPEGAVGRAADIVDAAR